MIEVIPLTQHVGAEIRGLDLSKELDPDSKTALREAWLKHLVLVFHDQRLSDEDQRRFTLLFGDIQPPRSRPDLRDPNKPYLFIGNVPVEGAIGELPEGDMQFHSDQCYYENPAKGAVLYALEIPSWGGATLFSSAYAAYDSLSEEMKQRVLRLEVLYLYDYEKNANRKAPSNWRDAPQFVHPAVVRHPESGRLSLLVNRLMADSIVGLPREESDRLIEELCQASERPEHIYEHKWRVGDVVIWDNRATLHARTDFDPKERRLLRRIAIRGARPIPAMVPANP